MAAARSSARLPYFRISSIISSRISQVSHARRHCETTDREYVSMYSSPCKRHSSSDKQASIRDGLSQFLPKSVELENQRFSSLFAVREKWRHRNALLHCVFSDDHAIPTALLSPCSASGKVIISLILEMTLKELIDVLVNDSCRD